MGSKSEIAWTNSSWNPVTGCDKVSAGCKHCYAENYAKRRLGEFGKDDRKFMDVKCHTDKLEIPYGWQKPRKIFVNSMSDLFHEDVPFEFIFRVYATMARCPKHTFQVLTKRPERALEFYAYLADWMTKHVASSSFEAWYKSGMKNLWFGVTAEDQEMADKRILMLMQMPVALRWVSIEPMLSRIDLQSKTLGDTLCRCGGCLKMAKDFPRSGGLQRIDWVVVGCESGTSRRDCPVSWINDIREACQMNKTPLFVKQLSGEDKVIRNIEDFPEHLKIREYPKDVV